MRRWCVRILFAALLVACAGAPAPRMATFELSGYILSGAEYWPYVGDREPDYPAEVLWGFYPEKGVVPPGETDPNADSATPAAVDCARRSHAALRAFLASDPPALRKVVERGAAHGVTPKFYLWTNDYSRASEKYPHEVRHGHLWYWKRKEPDPARPPGYWKWEATLTREGVCEIPAKDQIDQVLAAELAKLPAE
jgi:hypothetical protein